MRTKGKATTFFTVFLSLGLLLFFGAIIALVVALSNNFTSDVKTFYVQHGGTDYRQDNQLILDTDKYLVFNIGYALGAPQNTDKLFDIKIVPKSVNLNYTVNGKTFYFAAEKDLSKGFDLIRGKDYFALQIPQGATLESVLSKVKDGAVTVDKETDLTKDYYFIIVVTSYNAKETINLSFKIKGVANET